MAFTSTAVSVGTSASALVSSDPRRRRVVLHNASGTGVTYIGGSDVTTANGFDLQPGDRLELAEAHPGDCSLRGAIYAINSAGTNTVRVLVGTD